MANLPKINITDITEKAKNGISNIDMGAIKDSAAKAGSALSEKASDIKDKAVETKDDITTKLTELDRMLEQSITDYNDAYTLMNDKGVRLFVERSRAIDSIAFVENLVNSIANKPKLFETDFEEIDMHRDKFVDSCEFADREIQAARVAAGGAGAGLAAGASVAFMAPTAAMWVATTFGTASTGTAISALSGAAASNAALAWLGGGALTAGGGGMAAGNALLAMAGPIGWTIAGATLLSSILLFASKKAKLNKQKNEEIEAVKNNIEKEKEIDAALLEILDQTIRIREELNKSYLDCVVMYDADYLSFNDEQKMKLGALVNNTKSLSAMFEKTLQ